MFVCVCPDLAESGRQVETEEARAYADENGILFVETSAKTNHMVAELFKTIAVKLPKNGAGGGGGAAGAGAAGARNANIVINPEDENAAAQKKGGCC